MRTIDLNRQLLGIEDLLTGFGVITQTRGGQTVSITKINAGSLPFDETQSLLQWAQTVNLAGLGAMTDELQAIYTSIEALNNLEDNLVALNTLAQAINCLNNLCNNLTKLQNIDTNMTKLQNIDTNMTKLQNIDINMTKLQNIDTNMTELSSIYSNMSMLQTVYDNMSSLNAINTQIIPHLSEILLADDYAAQVSADKTTVANDKASVASMKLAVETIYDTFDDRFLGTKTNDPILDNDGNALSDGAMYFNTSVNALKVYDLDNAVWVTIPQIYLSGLLDVTLTSITTGDILTWNGSKWVNTRTPSFDSIKLNGGTNTNGTATWNNTEYTYDIVLNPNVTLQVGQEDLVYCKNNTASLIANGRPVMAVGTNGNSGNILVDLHDGTKANARRIVGIATEDLTANGYGFVTRNGKVRGVNTTGSQYGETWVDGDILYVKATGALTKVEPADTTLKMPIAFVIHAHTNGTLYVRTTGIDENHDRDLIATKVAKVASTDNAITRFDGTTGQVQNSGVIIDDNGNVGIGTGSPIDKLTMYSASGNLFSRSQSGTSTLLTGVYSDGTTCVNSLGNYPLILLTNNAERMRIDANGNVGIGTNGYTYGKLGIQGQIGTNCSSLEALSTRGLQFFVDGYKFGNLSVDNSSNLLYIGGGLGYGAGSGGTVTQLTSKSTAVTLNKPSGQITMNNSALAAGATVKFDLNNSLIASIDNIILTLVNGDANVGLNYKVWIGYIATGVCAINVQNTSGASRSEALVLKFDIIKGATA